MTTAAYYRHNMIAIACLIGTHDHEHGREDGYEEEEGGMRRALEWLPPGNRLQCDRFTVNSERLTHL